MKYKIAKRKLLAYSVVPTLGIVGIIGAQVVSAHGMFGMYGNATPDEIANRQQTMFQNEAQILGISVDDLKAAWAEGKSFKKIMDEKGIDQTQVQTRMKDAKISQLKTQLQTLVDKGIITQAQADKRLQVMQDRMNSNTGMGSMMGMGRGMRHGWGGF